MGDLLRRGESRGVFGEPFCKKRRERETVGKLYNVNGDGMIGKLTWAADRRIVRRRLSLEQLINTGCWFLPRSLVKRLGEGSRGKNSGETGENGEGGHRGGGLILVRKCS